MEINKKVLIDRKVLKSIIDNTDFKKLIYKLKKIHANSKKTSPTDPCRGLSGKLLKKVLAGLAGHRSGALTEKEIIEIEKIQKDYDLKNKNK